MRGKRRDKEQGYVMVEAVVILPLAILSVVLLIYLSLFLFWRANLQATLETALVYYKNTVTDTYVTRNDEIAYMQEDDSSIGAGNSYSARQPLSPYRGMFGDGTHVKSQEAFEKYFYSAVGGQLFKDNLELTIDFKNYIYVKQFEVTATQKVSAPIDFSMLGIGNEYVVSATARVAVADHDSVIRDGDYAISLFADTKLGEMAKDFGAKVAEVYGKMKSILGA